MITKNMTSMLLAGVEGSSGAYLKFNDGSHKNVSYTVVKNLFKIMDGTNPNSNNQTMFFFGNGTTEPTYYDLDLESYVDVKRSAVGCEYTKNTSLTEDGYMATKAKYTTTVVNNTTEPIIVSELGLFYVTSIGNSTKALLYREVFEPITLQPNDSYTFVVDIA